MDPIIKIILVVLIGMGAILLIAFLPDMIKAIRNHHHDKVIEQWLATARCLKSFDPDDPSVLRVVFDDDYASTRDDLMEIHKNKNNTYGFVITTVNGNMVSGTVDATIFERMTLMPVANYIHRNIDHLPEISVKTWKAIYEKTIQAVPHS